MRASKLRLPDRTAAQTRSFFTITSLSSAVRSPELPMQVVQPYAATLNPSFSRYGNSPVRCRYSVTTREPGASEVLIWAGTDSPASTAFLAIRPAASRTLGLLVLVHEVIAAISTSPFLTSSPLAVANERCSCSFDWLNPLSAIGLENRSENVRLT